MTRAFVAAPDRAAPPTRPPAPAAGRFTPLWALFILTVREHLHGRRWVVMAGLFLLPAALAVLIRSTAPDARPAITEFLLAFMFIPQALLPLVALVYASGIIQDEQEDQTLTYLLVRPIPRWAIYVVKLLATVCTTVLLTAVFTALTYAAIYVGEDTPFATAARRCLTAVGVHALAVVAYCCLFGLISLFTKRALVLGVLYAALIEGLLANLPFGVRLITVIYYARLIAYRSMDFKFEQNRRTVDMAAEAWQLDVVKDPQLLAHPTLQTCVLVLVGASVAFTAVAAVICARREFHVKTPEGS